MSNGYRDYRYFHDIKWGDHYNPETGAHHIESPSPEAIIRSINPAPAPKDLRSVQVKDGDTWRWVTETPISLGGICPE